MSDETVVGLRRNDAAVRSDLVDQGLSKVHAKEACVRTFGPRFPIFDLEDQLIKYDWQSA